MFWCLGPERGHSPPQTSTEIDLRQDCPDRCSNKYAKTELRFSEYRITKRAPFFLDTGTRKYHFFRSFGY